MAVRQITTRLAIDGEQEYKKQLAAVNRELGNLGAEMKLVDAQFKGQANSAAALREKHRILSDGVSNSENKVKSLEDALKEAADAYGENDKRTDSYRRQLLSAETALAKLNSELNENEKLLKEAEDSADGCAKSIDGYGKAVKEADRDVDGFGDSVDALGGKLKNADGSWNFKNLTGTLGELKGALMGGAVVTGVTALYGAIRDVVEETQEYRKIMGTLETSSAAANYSTKQTEEAFRRLYGVLGDTQTAATTVANLQAIGLAQGDLRGMIDSVIGAWATYGDSIPIDGLAESINETIQAGKVTGTFADVLNWAGVSEDAFNEKLEESNDSAERAQIVLNQLANQSLPETGEAWRNANADIVAYNEAQADLNEAMGELGEKLQPLVTRFTQFKSDMIRQLGPVVDWLTRVIDKIVELGNTKLNGSPKKITTTTIEGDYIDPDEGVVIPHGSHAAGLDRVPYDGYIAELHMGEAVLNAQEAALWRSAVRYSTSGAPAAFIPVPSPTAAQSAARRERGLTAGQAAVPGQSSGDVPQLIEVRATVELDGEKVGEAVTRHQLARERAGRQ